jgi:hypothetical protein
LHSIVICKKGFGIQVFDPETECWVECGVGMHALSHFGNEAKFSEDCILPFWSMFIVNKSVRIIVAWSLNINVSSAMVV